MIQKSENNRSLLLEILSEMFTYTYDSNDEVTGVMINPSLTFKELQSLVKRTRKIIIKLYTECEEDYNTGLDIYFALIQEKMLSKLLIQDEALQDVALRRKLNEFMIPKLERSIIVNPYENPYQNQNLRNNIFIPPQFKSRVMQELKKIFKKNNETEIFDKFVKDDIDLWLDEEIRNATDTLDPYQVAKEFYDFHRENAAYDKDEDDSALPAPSSASSSSASSASASPASASTASASTASASTASASPVSASPVSASPVSASTVSVLPKTPGTLLSPKTPIPIKRRTMLSTPSP
jgi:hypothetical protein